MSKPINKLTSSGGTSFNGNRKSSYNAARAPVVDFTPWRPTESTKEKALGLASQHGSSIVAYPQSKTAQTYSNKTLNRRYWFNKNKYKK